MSAPSKLIRFFAEIDREAWLRFFIAMAGLVCAFAFAVLSTSFRDQGNLFGTAITASLALLTAVLVGVTTVPYLARKVATERLRFNVRYELTREGLIYIIAVLVIGIAALNTGNNLLFIVVAAMLAALLVSGVSSTVVLFGLDLHVSLPDHVFAGKPFLGTVTLVNQSRLPSFSVSVVPEKSLPKRRWKWQRTEIGVPPFRPAEEQWFRVPDLQLRSLPPEEEPPPILQRPAYFPYLRAHESESVVVELNFPRRGKYVQDVLGLATRFPFSFLTKTRIVSLERELIVLPAIGETEEFLAILPTLRGEFEVFLTGRGYDLFRLREFLPGDAARHIDWKATARSQSLMVREFTREDERKLKIVFDNPPPGVLSEEEYESAVRLAASLAWHFADGATEISFAAPDYEGPQEAVAFLKYLAVVEPAEEKSSVLGQLASGGAYNLVVTARPRGSIPTHIWNTSYFIFMGK
ncbi:MAG TPA: DUF58 domain-containing protein [Terriglobales bacterium]|nr:DUF58 domain-containing protein [Terriglobales bacterium]